MKKEVKELKDDLKEVKRKNKLLGEVTQYNISLVEDIASRLDSVEMSNARRSATLSGLYTDSRKSIMMHQVSSFFDDVLDLNPSIEDVYQIGSKDPKPIVIIFNTADDKRSVFQSKHQLKGYKNKDGAGYYLNDYLPAKVNEKKRREREIANIAKAEEKQDNSNKVEYNKLGIKVGPTQYKKRITPPTHIDILRMRSTEMEEIQKIPVKKGTVVQKDGNTFIPYSIDTNNTQAVANAYMKIRLSNARARHIICAYRLPGTPDFIYNDSCDDDDFGMGRVILDLMKQSKITNKAIFIVRHCSKIKMGSERAICYKKAAENVMIDYPYNELLNVNQTVDTSDKAVKDYQAHTKKTKPQQKTSRRQTSISDKGFQQKEDS